MDADKHKLEWLSDVNVGLRGCFGEAMSVCRMTYEIHLSDMRVGIQKRANLKVK